MIPGPRRFLLKHRWLVIGVSILLVLGVLEVGLWLSTRVPTYQQILDGGLDQDHDGDPDYFPQFHTAVPVLIRDRVVSLRYQDSPLGNITVEFRYLNGKWPFYNFIGYAPAIVNDNLGAYAPGDTIELVGSVFTYRSHNLSLELPIWALPAGVAKPGPPSISMQNMSAPGFQHALEVAEVSRSAATVHYGFLLLLEGQGIERLSPDANPNGSRMRFKDLGSLGFMDVGDQVLFGGLQTGNYTCVVEYARVEVARFPFYQT